MLNPYQTGQAGNQFMRAGHGVGQHLFFATVAAFNVQ